MLSLLDHHITGLFDNIKMKPCGVTIQVKPLCQTFWLSLEVFDVTKVKLMEVYKVIIVLKFKGKGCIRYTSDNNTLFLECSGNKFLLMEYHPGIFINKWTCCDGREKTAQGCQKSFAANEDDGYQGKSKHFIDYYEFTNNVPKVASIRMINGI